MMLTLGLFVFFCFILVSVAAGLYFSLCVSVKKEINAAPRLPMYTCDRHGPFPAKSCLHIEVPTADQHAGEAPLVVDMCPLCYAEKMHVASELLKA